MAKWQVLEIVPAECRKSVADFYEDFRDRCQFQYAEMSWEQAAIEFCKWRGDIA